MTLQAEAQVRAEVLDMMSELAGDWEYSDPITPQTRLLGDVGLESLDLVVLGTAIQERYGRLPVAEFLAEVGERPVQERDVSVQDLVSFICRHRGQVATGRAR